MEQTGAKCVVGGMYSSICGIRVEELPYGLALAMKRG